MDVRPLMIVQDWNISRKELEELVDLGVLSPDEAEEVRSCIGLGPNQFESRYPPI